MNAVRLDIVPCSGRTACCRVLSFSHTVGAGLAWPSEARVGKRESTCSGRKQVQSYKGEDRKNEHLKRGEGQHKTSWSSGHTREIKTHVRKPPWVE
jgi:hypothetical protein